MSSPKFSVGEEVIVNSLKGDFSFESVVTEVFQKGCFVDGIGYTVNPDPFPHPIQEIVQGWTESCLRKKHKPGDSFEAIMNSCKAGEIV